MSVIRGAAVGALTLTMLDVLVGTDQAAGRVGGLLTGVAGLAEAFMNPDVPAIRDRSGCLDHVTAAQVVDATHKGQTAAAGVTAFAAGVTQRGTQT